MHSFIYVSERPVLPGEPIGEVDDIVWVARSRNAALSVTGALIATRNHFAQILEGPEAALAELLASLQKDHRHQITQLIHLEPKSHRDFKGWSLAYHGESSYVSNMLVIAAGSPGFQLNGQVDHIRSLMQMFA